MMKRDNAPFIPGDNHLILSSISNIPSREEIKNLKNIKLIYIDPPFGIAPKEPSPKMPD